MKCKAKGVRPQLRHAVNEHLLPKPTLATQSTPVPAASGLAVRTGLKAGLTALLLQQAAAAGAAAGNGVVT